MCVRNGAVDVQFGIGHLNVSYADVVWTVKTVAVGCHEDLVGLCFLVAYAADLVIVGNMLSFRDLLFFNE